jgi:ElaB/YqjD/DUF883 family membrane-anchored ribosome-binding protein
VNSLAPDAANVLAMLGDEQIAELTENLQARNSKTREEFPDLSGARQHENRVERMEKRLQRRHGRLTAK